MPIWTPDDASVVFATQREQTGRFSFYQQSADGAGDATKLLEAEHSGGNFKPYVWTPNGEQLLFDYGPAAALNIGVLTLGEEQDWQPLLASEFIEAAPSLSRDGNWMAYSSTRSGACEIYIERFPELGSRTRISVSGGTEPLWSPTRDELYYRQGPNIYAVSINFENGVDAGDPEVIASGIRAPTGCTGREYDISGDGERFLVMRQPVAEDGSISTMELVLVQNWFEELKRLVPVN